MISASLLLVRICKMLLLLCTQVKLRLELKCFNWRARVDESSKSDCHCVLSNPVLV